MSAARTIAVTLCVAGAIDAAAGIRFEDVTAASGLDFVTTSGAMPSTQILEVNGSGLALFDHDDDGDLDLFVANGATLAEPGKGPGSRPYANRGDGTFEDVTAAVGLKPTRWAMGAATGDYDGDGDDDLYVTCYGPNVLLRNDDAGDGQRRVVEVTAEAGVGDPRWGTSAAFGDLDLYVANYLVFDAQRPPPRGSRTFKGGDAKPVLRLRWPGGTWTEQGEVPVNRRVLVSREGRDDRALRGRAAE